MMESRTGDKFSQAYGQRWRGALLLMAALPVIATLALLTVGVFRGRPADFAQMLSNGPTPWQVYADSDAVGLDWGEHPETASIFGEDHEHWSAENQGCTTQAWPTTQIAGICESSGIHGQHTLGSLLPVIAWNGTAFALGRADNEVSDPSHWDLDADLGWAEGEATQLNCLTLPLPLEALETGILPGKDGDGEAVSLMNFEALVAARATCPSVFLWR